MGSCPLCEWVMYKILAKTKLIFPKVSTDCRIPYLTTILRVTQE